uniref:Degenerin deg-1 n=1 Tax=Ascaris suum TaxID=6253 RepID=F1KZA3_ASCSU
MDMECIRFESPPTSDSAKCICTYDREMNVAWPCFNISIWSNEECPSCFEDGHCEPSTDDVVGAKWPCMCRSRRSDLKPYCIGAPMEIRKLWTGVPDEDLQQITWPSTITSNMPTTTLVTTTPSTTTTTSRAPSRKNQSARVTAPETVKAMGFTGMTDGVAMLTRAKENLIFTMSALSEMQRIALSHSKREFIEMCSFNGRQCDIDVDFKLHVDPEFGNCFTFNWDKDNNRTSSKAGPMYGIRVMLFVNTSDYMVTSESSGVRIAVHSPTDFPFPDTFGYSAPVGFASSFGLKKQVVERLAAPYGDCETRKKMNSSWYIYGDYDYNAEGCHRSCFQNALLAKCACGDPRFPVPRGRKHCAAFNATARACLERAILEIGDFHHITDLEDCVCKQPCEHETFSVTFSASKWPSGATDLGDCEGMTERECETYYSKNAAMVEVYYEQLNYELLKESEAYGLVNLLADVGGHLGLWMGFSVITIIECAVLLFDLITLCCKRRKEKKQFENHSTSHLRNENDQEAERATRKICATGEKPNVMTFQNAW